jgi:hypothetical protein
MSSITSANAASNALPTVNFHPHGRGHGKKGSDMESQSVFSIGSVGQMPVGASQGLLGNMLQSLQQTVGSQATAGPAPTTAATGTTAAISNLESSFNTLMQGAGGAATASTAAAGGTTATSSTGSLQNFLTNVLQNLQTNGLQVPNLSGSRVNAKV